MKDIFNLKKCIIVFVKVCLALFLFTCLTLLFMPKYIDINEDGRIMSEFYREKTPTDVVLTGASLVHSGVSPMALYRDYGICAYDRSGSSQPIALSYYVIEDTIKRNKPELVIADVGFMYESIDYINEGANRKALDGMKWSSSKIGAIKAVMGESEKFIDYVFPILRFHSRWNDLTKEDIKFLFYKPNVTYNGQLLKFDNVEGFHEYNPNNYDSGQTICSENMDYLQKIIELCKNNQVQLLLIKMPCFEGNWNENMESQIIDFAEKNNIIYKNFTYDYESIGLNLYEDFDDVQHLNSIGAEKFTKILGSYIKDNYSITDQRSNLKIKEVYDKKLQRYETDMNNKRQGYHF